MEESPMKANSIDEGECTPRENSEPLLSSRISLDLKTKLEETTSDTDSNNKTLDGEEKKKCSNTTTQTEPSDQHSLAMLASYLAASQSWQWQHLVLLTRQQLQLVEKLTRRPKTPSRISERKNRVLFTLRKKAQSRSFLLHNHTNSNHQDRNHGHVSFSDPKPSPEAGQSHLCEPKPLESQRSGDPHGQESNATSTASEEISSQRIPPGRDLEGRSTHSFTVTRRAQHVLQNFPIASYLKLFLVLFFLNVPVYCIFGVVLCGVIHAVGTFNPLFRQFHDWLENTGLTQRRSFAEVMAELRSLRQQREQQRQAETQESRIYQELQQQARIISSTTPNASSETTEESCLLQPSTRDTCCRSPQDTVSPPSSHSERLFFWARWFYQLVVAFFSSLNPQWGPLVAFILPQHTTPPTTSTPSCTEPTVVTETTSTSAPVSDTLSNTPQHEPQGDLTMAEPSQPID